jgi:hypothetical protein
MVVLLVVLVLVGGALLAAVISGRDAAVIAIVSASPRPVATPIATPRPTPTPVPRPTAAPTPTPAPTPTQKPRPGSGADLCDPILGFACRLDAGTYQPSRFAPEIRFVLGDGWSTSTWESDLIVLTRTEGNLTFAGTIAEVFPSGDASDPPGSARGLIETFIGTDGVAAGRPVDEKIDKRKTTFVDLAPTGPDRVPLFGTSTQTFYLEPGGTTRVVVIDAKGGPFVLAIEPAQDSTLEAILPTAGRVADSVQFR